MALPGLNHQEADRHRQALKEWAEHNGDNPEHRRDHRHRVLSVQGICVREIGGKDYCADVDDLRS